MGISTSSPERQNPPAVLAPSFKVKVASCLLRPPKEEGLIFKVLVDDIWERVFSLLSSRDLLALMLSSREAMEIVRAFVVHFVTSDDRLYRLDRVFSREGGQDGEGGQDVAAAAPVMPLLLQEKALGLKLRQLQKKECGPTLIHMKAIKMFVESNDLLRRENVFNADWFPHFGNSNYIVKEFDELLDRDIVRLRSVCWLTFAKKFRDVRPGMYEFSLRIRLLPNLHWPSFDPPNEHSTYIEAKRECDNPDLPAIELSSQAVEASCWNSIQRRQFDWARLTNATIRFDGIGTNGSSWMSFILKPFCVQERSTLIFEFRDVQNPNWKSGMDWDFIQLKKLD